MKYQSAGSQQASTVCVITDCSRGQSRIVIQSSEWTTTGRNEVDRLILVILGGVAVDRSLLHIRVAVDLFKDKFSAIFFSKLLIVWYGKPFL